MLSFGRACNSSIASATPMTLLPFSSSCSTVVMGWNRSISAIMVINALGRTIPLCIFFSMYSAILFPHGRGP